jgi:hypothetical protein
MNFSPRKEYILMFAVTILSPDRLDVMMGKLWVLQVKADRASLRNHIQIFIIIGSRALFNLSDA